MRGAAIVSLLAVVAVGCSTAPSSDWDAEATSSLEAEVPWMLNAIDSGDISGMLARMDPDAIVFDTDDQNRPVRARGAAEVQQYMGGMEEAMKQGLKFASRLTSNDCHATGTLGFCAVEFEQTITSGGQTQGPFKFRGTLVARKVGDAWRWVHWHGSMAEMPQGV